MLRFKKKVATILAIAMGISALAGCQQNHGADGTESGNEQVQESGQAAQGDSGEKEKLVVALPQNTNVESYEENHLTNLLEEELGIEIEFYYLPADEDDARTKISTMVNGGGELPDVIVGLGYGQTDLMDFGSNGIFISLNDYLADESVAQYFNQIPEDDRNMILENMRSVDGNVYALPTYSAEDWNMTPYRFWINQTWMDALNLEMPTTTDEFAAVMESFLNEDPNGNGQKDEIPITGTPGGWGTNTFYFLMNAFEYFPGVGLTLSEDGKTLMTPFTTEAYRKGLEYMKDLCDKGILSPAIFTQDAAQMTAILSNETQIVGGTCAGGYGYWSNSENNPNFQDMVLMPPLKGPEGVAYAVYATPLPATALVITRDCKNPELAFKFGDLFYREDISITNRYGEEGVDWTRDPEITKQYKGMYEEVSGIPCSFAILNDIWSKPQSKSWYDIGPCYRGTEFYRGIDERKPEDENAVNYYALTRAQSAEYYADAHPEHILVNLIYTQEEAEEIAEIVTDITSYVGECNAAFVTGNMDLVQWDNYLRELDKMGLQRWLEIGQTAYDRMKNQ